MRVAIGRRMRAQPGSTMADERDEVLDFLGRGETYGRPGEPVEQVTTHAARIFLVNARAFKMKRPVRYSFLDFSTLARRRAALESELELNRRTAPMLYRRLLPMTRGAAGALTLDGAGEPVEWLLEMSRFDQDMLLDRLAERGALDAATIDELAAEIAGFHERAEVREDRGGYAGMREVIEGNAADFAGLAGGVFERAAVAELNRRTAALLAQRRELLERRRAAGRVRHCHGDLHLGNIVLWEGRPVLFDCLEFDPELATIDTFYDLAFLLMDLCHRNLRPLAQRLLSGYLDATGDDQGTALLPLFLSVRAAIRAKVEGFTADLAEDASERAALVATARAYLDLATHFLAPEPPRLIAIGGVSGTGKTTLARRLAPTLGRAPGAVLLRSDTTRKKLCGAAPDARLGPEAYDEQVSRRVYTALMTRAGNLLAAGQAVVVDAVMLDPAERARVEQVARQRSVRFDGLWLSAPAPTLAARVAGRSGDASDATPAVVEAQLGVDPGALAWHRIESGGAPEQVATAARAALGARRSGLRRREDKGMFKALVLEKGDDRFTAEVRELDEARLPAGDVTVAVEHSTLNYKDGLVIADKAPLVRSFPHVPGIDFAGRVVDSAHPDWRPGDAVILTGWGVGERYWGGHAGRARVKGEWLVPLPAGWTARQAMAIGTAGFTAMLAVIALEQHGLEPGAGEVLVTGAAGGVGSVAIALLAKLGHQVTASTGRAASRDYLRALGATAFIDRSELAAPSSRPLESERFAGCIDAVGGTTLARVLSQMRYGCSVAAVGLAGGSKLETTVIPFLLRGVNLLGIDSVYHPVAPRRAAWQRLARDLDPALLDRMIQPARLEDLPRLAGEILAGRVQGRIVVDL